MKSEVGLAEWIGTLRFSTCSAVKKIEVGGVGMADVRRTES